MPSCGSKPHSSRSPGRTSARALPPGGASATCCHSLYTATSVKPVRTRTRQNPMRIRQTCVLAAVLILVTGLLGTGCAPAAAEPEEIDDEPTLTPTAAASPTPTRTPVAVTDG